MLPQPRAIRFCLLPRLHGDIGQLSGGLTSKTVVRTECGLGQSEELIGRSANDGVLAQNGLDRPPANAGNIHQQQDELCGLHLSRRFNPSLQSVAVMFVDENPSIEDHLPVRINTSSARWPYPSA